MFGSVKGWIDVVMQHLEDVAAGRVHPGILSSIEDLDFVVGGWKPGQLIVIAGKPDAGKTALALTFARAAAREGYQTAFFSSESPREELLMRVLAAEGEVPLDLLTTGKQFTKENLDKVAAARKVIGDWPLRIDQCLTLEEIEAEVHRFANLSDEMQLVVVDGLYRLVPDHSSGKWEQDLAEVTHRLKDLAMSLGIAVITTAPLSYHDRLPELDDLHDPVAQTADMVQLLHCYKPGSEQVGKAYLSVAKNRNGLVEPLMVVEELHFSRFVDMPH